MVTLLPMTVIHVFVCEKTTVRAGAIEIFVWVLFPSLHATSMQHVEKINRHHQQSEDSLVTTNS